jgi:hypothetical protein
VVWLLKVVIVSVTTPFLRIDSDLIPSGASIFTVVETVAPGVLDVPSEVKVIDGAGPAVASSSSLLQADKKKLAVMSKAINLVIFLNEKNILFSLGLIS